ncbi:MAG: Asp-tRNA(Asn)/Glu-tRNA(Gln) amidotransferase subunit GatA [Caldisericia bacterium]|nr:Asp-tRNA(Asn)/Glu-tRNA(Gln) amidotransferase subunit GatA [Caldisericia bacterium]
MEVFRLSLLDTLKLLRDKKISPKELLNIYLKRIEEKEKEIDSFLYIDYDGAFKRAEELEKEDRELPLYGIIFSIKDNILVKNLPNTCGSKILENFIAPYDAFVIEKLKRYGAIIIGKTNMDEFAMGSSTENSSFKITKNPWDFSRVPGGSSGGSAASIASDLVISSLGSDTGGSVRQPASFCGVVGIKPTYGTLSRFGLVAFASSLDQIGIFGKNVDDTFYVLNLLMGYDPRDSTSLNINYKKIVPFDGKIKIGIIKELNTFGIDENVLNVFNETIEILNNLGYEIKEVSLPNISFSLPVYYLIAFAEASSNLARYDGVRYGLRVNEKSLKKMYTETRKSGFGKEVKRRILLGTFALSSGYYEQWYLKASKVRKLITEDFKNAFKEVDAIILPTSPFLPFKIGERIKDPIQMYLSDVMTIPVNLVGIPGINVPVGIKNNLPIGIQVLSNYLEESKIYRVSLDLEREINFQRIL